MARDRLNIGRAKKVHHHTFWHVSPPCALLYEPAAETSRVMLQTSDE